MPILASGSNITLSVAAGQVLTVQSDQATFDYESPVGTRLGEFASDMTFGPFAAAGAVKVTSVQGAVFYDLSNGPSSAVSYVPASVAITGGSVGEGVKIDAIPSSGLNALSLGYDLVVYGATPSGIFAATSAAKAGVRVLLISPNGRIGGIDTGGLARRDYEGVNANTGLNSAVRAHRAREAAYYGKDLASYAFSGTAPMAPEPKVAEQLYRDFLREHAVPVLYGYRVQSVIKPQLDIEALIVEKVTNTSDTKRIGGRVFIDASYESDLMMRSGVTYTSGREATATYGEALAGVRTLQNSPTLASQPSSYITDGVSGSGLLPYIDAAALEAQGTADTRIQAFNHRLIMTTDAANQQAAFPEPLNYNPLWYEVLGRAMALNPGSFTSLSPVFLAVSLPNIPLKFDVNNSGSRSSDFIGGNVGFVTTDYDARRTIVENHFDYTLGLIKFLRTDARVPAAVKSGLEIYRFTRDEFASDDYLGVVGPAYAARLQGTGMSPDLYIRESARMVGEVVLTQAHAQKTTIVTDPIAYGTYPIDSHFCSRRDAAGVVQAEGGMSVASTGAFGIDYKMMLPKSYECTNLLVSCNGMSASHVGWNATRLEYTLSSLGEAAGWAAALSIRGNRKLHNITGAMLQPYVRHEAVTPTNRIDLSGASASATPANATLTWTGTWTYGVKTCPDYFGLNGFASDGGGGSKASANVKVQFNTTAFPAGKYRIRVNLPVTTNSQVACTVTVKSVDGTRVVYPKVKSGRSFFVDIGIYNFAGDGTDFVQISNQGDPGISLSGSGTFNLDAVHLESVA